MDRDSAEKEAFMDKFFSCSEAPIKEWLAEYRQKPVEELFSDYVDETDVVGFMHEGTHYTAYVVTMPGDNKTLVSADILKSSEKARMACSMLYDAVQKVFYAVVQSVEDPELKKIVPCFVEPKMAFRLYKVDTKAVAYKYCMDQKSKVTDEEQVEVLDKLLSDLTPEALEESRVENTEENQKLAQFTHLHIVVEKTDLDNIEVVNASMRRLPMFGTEYHDPEEPTVLDKILKQ